MTRRRGVVLGLVAAGLLPAAGRGAALRQAIVTLEPFRTAPFPYRGQMPDNGGPFINYRKGGRNGHLSPRGGVYWEDETYSDRRVLLAVPAGFDPDKPAVIVLFFHGNGATLQNDVAGRQRVVDQVFASGLNAVLVAPQFAVNALDSSAGGFWQPGALARFLDEAAEQLARITGAKVFAEAPVVLVAYSGGYNPAAFVLNGGGADGRILGVILLDAVFGEVPRFARWIARNYLSAFFVSAYGPLSADANAELSHLIGGGSTQPPVALIPGTVAFIGTKAGHDGFVTSAFVDNPLQWLLARLPGFPR